MPRNSPEYGWALPSSLEFLCLMVPPCCWVQQAVIAGYASKCATPPCPCGLLADTCSEHLRAFDVQQQAVHVQVLAERLGVCACVSVCECVCVCVCVKRSSRRPPPPTYTQACTCSHTHDMAAWRGRQGVRVTEKPLHTAPATCRLCPSRFLGCGQCAQC